MPEKDMFTEPRMVWPPCSWIPRMVWGLHFLNFRYDQVPQIRFYFPRCVVDLSVELRAELLVSRTMPPQHSKSQLQSKRAEATAVGRLRYRVLRRAVLRQSADMGAQKTGGVLVPGEVVVATAVNGRRVEIGERVWVSTETAGGRKLLQHIDAILQVIYATSASRLR